MQIIPAVIPKSFAELEEKMALVAGLVPEVQVDALDGSLVPMRAWPYQSAAGADIFFKEIVAEKRGFPFWEKIDFETHFMTAEPEESAADWISAGAIRLIPQVETITPESWRIIQKEAGGRAELALSINLDTPISALEPYIKDITIVQAMGIAKIGAQGQPFDERTILRVAELRRLYPKLIISVDGGVSLENAEALVKAGASRLVVGSAFWKSIDLCSTLASFHNLCMKKK